MKIVGTAISMTRGDSESITFSCQDEDGNKINFVEGDTVYFTIKKSVTTEEKILQKVITIFTNGEAIIVIDPADTKTLKYGTFKYDIQLTSATGSVTTVILPSDFTINGEVTYE